MVSLQAKHHPAWFARYAATHNVIVPRMTLGFPVEFAINGMAAVVDVVSARVMGV